MKLSTRTNVYMMTAHRVYRGRQLSNKPSQKEEEENQTVIDGSGSAPNWDPSDAATVIRDSPWNG
jgi:hypothetical protein